MKTVFLLMMLLIGLFQGVRPDSAEQVALNHPDVVALTEGRRVETFQVMPLVRYMQDGVNVCGDTTCEQVMIYDFEQNATISAIVDSGKNRLIDALLLSNSTPPFSERVEKLAKRLVVDSEEVSAAVGRPIAADEIVFMHMQHENCPTNHLCLGATFTMDSGGVFVLVDATDETIADIWWSGKTLESDEPTEIADNERFGDCSEYALSRDGWVMDFRVTPSDGLGVAAVSFDGKQILNDARLTHWAAHYVNGGGWGFLDYTGCQGGGGGFAIFPSGPTETPPLAPNSPVMVVTVTGWPRAAVAVSARRSRARVVSTIMEPGASERA